MHTKRLLLPALAAACISLTACGDVSEDNQGTVHKQTTAVSAPLLDDEGRPQGSGALAEPADAGARTRAGLYASEAQARQLEAALGDRAISTRVDDSASMADAVDLAVLVAYGAQAAHDLDSHAPVLVRGKNLRLAAAAANRLHAGGFTRVFLVTQ